MSDAKYYIKVKDKNIPIIVRNYSNTNKIKIYFRGDILNISKPRRYSIDTIIKEYGNEIYNQYMDIISLDNNYMRHWMSDEKIMYKGDLYNIKINYINENKIFIDIDDRNNLFIIEISQKLDDVSERNKYIIKYVKSFFKYNTEILINEKLNYWCKIMNLTYSGVKINDTVSKYGSCMPKNKKLFFSLRLIMMPERIVDAIVVHELAHMIYPNHSSDFYNYVKKYISDYDECDKWLKDNSSMISL